MSPAVVVFRLNEFSARVESKARICSASYCSCFALSKLNKSAPVTFEEGKKLLGPSTKYVVEDLASRCIASLMEGITEENCLELKFLALDVNNTEFSRLIDEKIETELQSPDPLILKSEFLKQLPMDKVSVGSFFCILTFVRVRCERLNIVVAVGGPDFAEEHESHDGMHS